jgi:hypothetical protein
MSAPRHIAEDDRLYALWMKHERNSGGMIRWENAHRERGHIRKRQEARMSALFARPEGYYETYPEVNWDLAQERWLGVRFPNSRSAILLAVCLTCSWSPESETVVAKPERRHVAEFITEAQHWYECPGVPQMKFWWLGETDL